MNPDVRKKFLITLLIFILPLLDTCLLSTTRLPSCVLLGKCHYLADFSSFIYKMERVNPVSQKVVVNEIMYVMRSCSTVASDLKHCKELINVRYYSWMLMGDKIHVMFLI